MSNIIQHKRNSTPGVIPTATGLQQAELGINIGDGKLYTKNFSNNIINLGVTSISGTNITPSSGNFSTGLTVNNIDVSLNGHSHIRVQQAESLVTNVFNKTANTIPKFSVVYINGGQGDQPTIQLAIATGEGGSSKTYGITAENISTMTAGQVVVIGALSGVNTDQFNPTAPVGDVNGTTLYLSPSISGSITTTKPLAPDHMVSVGTIVRTHQNAGVVEVKIQNGFELGELHNVSTNGPTDNGKFLQYNSTSGLWLSSNSGNFSTLQVNGTGVSVSGHLHTSSDISNFNTSVSGLLTPYQLSLTNPVTGTGITNHISYWNSSSGIVADSGQLYWDPTNNRLGIGTISPANSLDVIGVAKADSFTSLRTNSTATGGGQIYLNGATGNRIDFNINGSAAPSFTTRSVGTKIVLYPEITASAADYALGVESGGMWFSVPNTTARQFRWYAGTTSITTLTGAGVLTVGGGTSQINVDSLRLDNNILSITTANGDLILKPNGNGALQADETGNLRGIYSVDFQRDRVSASGVATGPYSVIAGGSNNTTTNNYSVVGGGQSNTANNAWALVCGGELNVASANRSTVCGGANNTSSDVLATIGGGQYNVSDAPYSIIPGGLRGKATRHGELSHAAGMFANVGDAQHTILIARRLTTDGTPDVVLTLNGLAPVSTNILNIPAQTMWTFIIKVSAYNVTNGEGAWWIFRGGIKRNITNNTVLVGSLISENDFEGSLSGATATVVADDTNEALEIRVTGIAGKSIRWVAVTDISQVSFGGI